MRTLLFLLALCVPLPAQEPIRYTVRFSAPFSHYLEVEASVPTQGQPSVELMMPVWTPGSYLVREYSRNVEAFQARTEGGQELVWEKTRKNRWRVDSASAPRIRVSYKVYAHEPSVQGNWVDAGFAMLNGAANFMTLAGNYRRPHEVKIVLPPQWKLSISGMKGANNEWSAEDYDELVDSPIYCGNAAVYEFEVAGRNHYLVNEGEGGVWDGPASAQAVRRIVEEYARMWDGLPYPKYVFFNMLIESGGGLEHKTSTWMNSSRWAWLNTQEPPPPTASGEPSPGPRMPSRLSWLGLVSHEYFHAWNVKRLRPAELGPFDYENEDYTRSLWIAEGVTSYYGPLALRRAGLSNREQFLRAMSTAIGALQNAPGRLVQPVERSSFDAWIKLYRPDENSPNTSISYYTKGEVLGFLLDAKIRKASNGAKSLDDAMKLAYQRYSGARGYTPEQFRQTASEVAGSDLTAWFHNAVDTTEELDYTEALDWYGLRFRTPPPAPVRATLGAITANQNGRLIVTGLRRGTAGYEAGLNVNDEILAIGEYRVRPEALQQRLNLMKPGEVAKVLIARRDRLETINVTLGSEPRSSWALEAKPDASEEQKARLKAFLRD
jgi:predicted metalloprotease with PDZ domain